MPRTSPFRRHPPPSSRSWIGWPTMSASCWTPIAASPRPRTRAGPITPAAEWLLDNYHLVEQQVREVRTDLPPGYYRQLPKLSSGPLAGYPRVFGVAWAFVAHTDSRFDPEALTRFVRAYQNVQPLTIGELWAVAITLRIVLVENLRRSAVRIMSRRAAREEADARGRPAAGRGRSRRRSRRRSSPTSARRSPRASSSSSSSACATRIPRRRRRVGWLERQLARRARPPTSWSARSISSRVRPTSRCATSSPACA